MKTAMYGVRARLTWWLLTTTLKACRWLLALAIAVAAWPLTVTAALGYAAAWLRGWPPARLWHAAAWSLPMTAVYLLGHAIRQDRWQAVAVAPARDWQQSWHLLTNGNPAAAFILAAPVAVPAGLAVAAVAWGWRIYAISTGLGGITASAPVIFDARQWRRQVRAAKGRIAAPGTVPLLAARDRIPVGGTIRTIGHRWQPVLAIPYAALGRHTVVIGATGTGKTNLLMRLQSGWFTAALRATANGGHRPLLVVMDCKGGPDARVKAARTRRLLYGAGARRVAIWPDDAALSLWHIPPAQLAVLLFQMIETGDDGPAAYYADVMQAVITLAVAAPPGPPASAADFLARLDRHWLEAAWADGSHPQEAARVRAARTHLTDIHLRFATLLGRLGPALDGPGTLPDADAWYCILEGTREPSVAEAQALAITELVAHAATARAGQPRVILLAADDYSAVSRRVPLSNLYERGRSLGIGVQVSAQSWHGLGASDDERYRIVATADGGIWVLNTPHPEPLARLAGTRRVLETAHHLIGSAWGDEGTTREQHAWIADPDIIRRLTIGQACYIRHGAATFVQIARPRPSPLTLPAAPSPAAPGRQPAPAPPGNPARPACPGRAGPGRRARPRDRTVTGVTDPFTALGLTAGPDLADAQVRAAWRKIAAATHPDRPDGGDTARYTAAVAAYAQLRTPWGRTEAYADLTAPPGPAPPPAAGPPAPPGPPGPPGARAAAVARAVRLLPARIRHGRPLRLAFRALAATALSLTALRIAPGQPAAPAVVAGVIVWFTLTVRADLAPMPGR